MNSPQPLNPKGTWRTYTTAEGLAGLQTEHLAEDAEGYLWIATCSDGVSRFDGEEFRTFTVQDGLCSNLVYAIHLDRQGRLWFGTLDKGICWYDGNAFHHLEGSKTASVTYLFEDQEERIWFSGRNTLGYYDATGFHDLLPVYGRKYDDPVYSCWGIAQDRQGDLWFGCNSLLRYDGACFHKYGEAEGLSAEVSRFHAIGQDGEGNLWVGAGNAIYRWDGQQFQAVPVDFQGGVRKIQQDREGRIWFCTSGAGVFCCDGTAFQHFTTQDGLAYETVVGMLQDREGQFWFATWGGGISCYDPHTLQVFSGVDLPHRQTYTLLEDHRGSVWAGLAAPASHLMESTVVRCDSEGLVAFGKEEGLDLGGCLAICEDRAGNLWVGGVTGLVRYDGQTVQRLGPEEGFEGTWVRTIREDEGGRLLFGHLQPTGDGGEVRITRYDGQGFQTLFRERGKDFASVNAILETSAGEFLFGLGVIGGQGQGKGIGRLNPAGEVSFYTVEDGLVDNRVEDLLEDRQGHLWVATLGGVSRFDGVRFQRFTTEDGLPHNQVHCIWEDRQGRLWFGTAGGVACFDGQVFQTIRSPAVIEVNDLLQDRQGDFWFATINGPVRYTPSQVPPRVRLLRTVADQIYEGVEGIKIPTSTRQVICEYKGLSFRTPPKDMLYTYRLVGREEEWQPATRQRQVIYQDLPLGKYTFEVRAIDRDLNYSAPARVRLKVVPDPRDARIDELEQRVRERTRELEEKNRALVMEAALERVRARALRMQKSEDISQAAAVVFRELRDLGLSIWICGFVIIDEEKDEGEIWYATPGGEAVQSEGRITQLSARPNLQGLYAAWKRKDALFCEDLVGEALEKQRRYLLEVVPYLRSLPAEAFPQRLVSTRALFSQGFLSMWGPEPNSEAGLEVVKRFTAAFSLIYTRFLDLQQAEEQAKQQTRAAAIERVRAEALSMRSADDLRRVVAVLFIEMRRLGVETRVCGIYFVDEATGDTRGYHAGLNPRQVGLSCSSRHQILEFSDEVAAFAWELGPSFSAEVSTWKREGKVVSQKTYWAIEQLIDGYQQVWDFPDELSKEELIEKLRLKEWAGEMWSVNVPFSHGVLAFSEKVFDQEHVTLLQELAQALDLGYLRFQDFQKLEEGNSALSSANKELFAVNKELQQTLEEKEKAQEALVRSESMAAIGTLVAGVAHELNNPLGAAYSLTQTVQEMIEEDTPEQLQQEKAEIVEHLAFSRKELNRAKEIVAALLGLSRQNQDYTEAVDLNTVVQDALRVLHNQYKKYEVNITEEYEEGLPAVQGNFAQLGQVCMNLIKNAIEALKGGEGKIALKTYREGEQVVFECADTGPGIPVEVQQRIFQPFFTTKVVGEGTGLGLYICHQTIEKHHGTIEVDSEVGKGTRFRVRLPARR